MSSITKLGMRQWLISATVFGGVLLGIATFDERFRYRLGDVVDAGSDLAPWTSRASGMADMVVAVARNQTFDSQLMVVFAVVGAVLVLFMWRT